MSTAYENIQVHCFQRKASLFYKIINPMRFRTFDQRKRKSKFLINDFISSSLLNWTSLKNLDLQSAQKKIDKINPRFKNLKEIQNVFLHCFYKSKKTEFLFEKT